MLGIMLPRFSIYGPTGKNNQKFFFQFSSISMFSFISLFHKSFNDIVTSVMISTTLVMHEPAYLTNSHGSVVRHFMMTQRSK